DAIGEHTGVSRVWLGTILLAGATSLPELVTTVSAGVIDEPDLAVGTVLGSNLFNMTIFGVIILTLPRAVQPDPAGLRSGLLALLLGVLVLVFLVVDAPGLGRIGLGSVVLIATYLVASNLLYLRERGRVQETAAVAEIAEAPGEPHGNPAATNAGSEGDAEVLIVPSGLTLQRAWILLGLSSAVVFVASIFLSDSAEGIARELQVTGGVVGVVGVAFATSLPEVVTSVAALRKGASGLVVGNVFGSNIFNIAVVFPSDLAFDGGGVLRAAQNDQAVTAGFGLVLVGLAAIVLWRRLPVHAVRLAGAGILAGYLAGVIVAVVLGVETG
ncbi:MAG TPA: hypothetical protein QGF05_15010, partial [Dehalococcoidia bacterium]|nr:hypothetical protein [Dehalococcoidia bacterium]